MAKIILLTDRAGILASLRRAIAKFLQIDGPVFAAAFTHYAFLSLFPLIVFFVTIASGIIDRGRAAVRIIKYIEQFIPIGLERQAYIFDIVATVIDDREEAGTLALILLLWSGSRFLSTLVRATNRAWGAKAHNWWGLPLKGFVLLGLLTAVASVGVIIPAFLRYTDYIPKSELDTGVYTSVSHFVRFMVTAVALLLFYKFAPRRNIRFADVWLPAVATAVLLQVLETVFGLYLRNFASLNAVYGALGSIVALLLWIYFSACIFIFGACFSAVRSVNIADDDNESRSTLVALSEQSNSD